MINLKAYSGKEKQNFISILNQAVSKGITDIRLLQRQMQKDFADDVKNNRMRMTVEQRMEAIKSKRMLKNTDTGDRPKTVGNLRCPDCGSIDVRVTSSQHVMESRDIEYCSVHVCANCRWSEIVEMQILKNVYKKESV